MTTADLSLASGEWGCGGHLAKLCASGRQAGRWYRGGQIHGLTPQPPTEPVSADFAEELASRARTEFGAKLGLGISLNADPKVSDGRPKPGTAHLVLEGRGCSRSVRSTSREAPNCCGRWQPPLVWIFCAGICCRCKAGCKGRSADKLRYLAQPRDSVYPHLGFFRVDGVPRPPRPLFNACGFVLSQVQAE